MRSFKTGLVAAALIGAILFPVSVAALAVPPVPTDVPIVDQTGTLTSEQITTLADKIAAERKSTGNQIGVLMIPSLQGDALEDYSLNVARTWGIGQKDRNSGVLLFIAKNDRKIRIEVGYGLEGALTDIRSGQIIRNRITPEFRQGKYYEGISSGIDGIIAAIHNEADPRVTATSDTSSIKWTDYIEPILIGIFVIPMWLGAILSRSKSWWAGGVIGGIVGGIISLIAGLLFTGLISIIVLVLLGLFFDWAVSRNYQQRITHGSNPSWWAGGGWGGGSSSSSSSGFGGFGGGGFGGGGSSGSW